MDALFYGAIGLIAGVLISFASKVLSRLYDGWMDRRTQRKQLRRDLSGSVLMLCDMIKDWDLIKPFAKSLREEFVDFVLQIRRNARSPSLDLQTDVLEKLMALTRLFLSIAAKKTRTCEEDWYRACSNAINDVRARLETLATRLS